jgi:hypothetical protein
MDRLAAEVGTPPGMLRGCVDRLLEGGTIQELGDDPRHEGEDPAPTLYGPRPLEDSPEDKEVTLD